MKHDFDSRSIQERFTHLFTVISSDRFLKMQGLGNEVPFFILPFNPSEALDMARLQKKLIKKLQQQGVDVLEINLYDLSIELLKNRGILEKTLHVETSVNKAEFMEHLQSVLDPESHLIPAIHKKMQDTSFHVMFLTGVGEVYPYVRSHNVLNNLQKAAKTKPTVMFFPGNYTHSQELGASLDLFGKLHEDRYYRAFDIRHYEI